MNGPTSPPHSRTPAWLLVATAIHAAALAGLLVVPLRDGRDLELSRRLEPPTEIAIAIESELAPVAASTRERAGEPAEAATQTSASPHRAPVAHEAREAASGATGGSNAASGEAVTTLGDGEARPNDETGTAGRGGVVVPIPLTTTELGIGGQNPFLPRAEEKLPTTGPDHPAARAMRGTGMARDRELGLGPEGPAISALNEATSSSVAPLSGRAVFVIRTGGDGLVLGIEVVDTEGGSGWHDARRIALESLRGKKFVVPRGATGLSMRIEVRSDMKLPNGQNAAVEARRGASNMPELTLPDVSNIGAKPRRVVRSRVVSTELL